jgi:cyclic pyranopterin phosphate synthase
MEPLVDKFGRPLRDLRISVTDRCNFRCTYCMPAEIYGERYEFLPKGQLLSFEEIARLTRLLVKGGVNKLRLTGGEPLVRVDVDQLIAMLSPIEGVDDITLTTNAYLLKQMAGKLKTAGLHRITVSLDSLDPEVFGNMNGRGYKPQRVLDGIQAATDEGLSPVKINAVVQKGVNDHTVVDMAAHFKGSGHILRFIEFMDVGNLNGWRNENVVSSKELAERINAVFPIEPAEPNYRGEVAERWRYLDGDGEIGFISSVSQPFCADCTRMRLSPEGELYTCLFATDGFDLRAPMRDGATDNELWDLISSVWQRRADRYSELRAGMLATGAGAGTKKIEMYHIGG